MEEVIKLCVSGMFNMSVKKSKVEDVLLGVKKINDKSIIQRIENALNSCRVTCVEVIDGEDDETLLCIEYTHPLNRIPSIYPVLDYTNDCIVFALDE